MTSIFSLCEKPTTSILQSKNDDTSTSLKIPKLKTASDLSSKTLSLLYPKFCSVSFLSSSVEKF